jgi:hypothetical protein
VIVKFMTGGLNRTVKTIRTDLPPAEHERVSCLIRRKVYICMDSVMLRILRSEVLKYQCLARVIPEIRVW